jgi:hypothetical protein
MPRRVAGGGVMFSGRQFARDELQKVSCYQYSAYVNHIEGGCGRSEEQYCNNEKNCYDTSNAVLVNLIRLELRSSISQDWIS